MLNDQQILFILQSWTTSVSHNVNVGC